MPQQQQQQQRAVPPPMPRLLLRRAKQYMNEVPQNRRSIIRACEQFRQFVAKHELRPVRNKTPGLRSGSGWPKISGKSGLPANRKELQAWIDVNWKDAQCDRRAAVTSTPAIDKSGAEIKASTLNEHPEKEEAKQGEPRTAVAAAPTDLDLRSNDLAVLFSGAVERSRANRELRRAARCGDLGTIQRLVRRGVDVNARDDTYWGGGATALHVAALHSAAYMNRSGNVVNTEAARDGGEGEEEEEEADTGEKGGEEGSPDIYIPPEELLYAAGRRPDPAAEPQAEEENNTEAQDGGGDPDAPRKNDEEPKGVAVGEEGGEEEKEEAKETGEAADAQGNNEEEKRSSADEPTAALEGFAALALAGGDAAAKEAALLAITEGESKQPFVPPTKPRRYRVGLRLNNKAAEVAENEIPPGSAPRFAPPVSMKYLDERVLVNVNFDKSTKVARVETLQPSSDARTVFIYNCSDLLSLLDDDEDSDIVSVLEGEILEPLAPSTRDRLVAKMLEQVPLKLATSAAELAATEQPKDDDAISVSVSTCVEFIVDKVSKEGKGLEEADDGVPKESAILLLLSADVEVTVLRLSDGKRVYNLDCLDKTCLRGIATELEVEEPVLLKAIQAAASERFKRAPGPSDEETTNDVPSDEQAEARMFPPVLRLAMKVPAKRGPESEETPEAEAPTCDDKNEASATAADAETTADPDEATDGKDAESAADNEATADASNGDAVPEDAASTTVDEAGPISTNESTDSPDDQNNSTGENGETNEEEQSEFEFLLVTIAVDVEAMLVDPNSTQAEVVLARKNGLSILEAAGNLSRATDMEVDPSWLLGKCLGEGREVGPPMCISGTKKRCDMQGFVRTPIKPPVEDVPNPKEPASSEQEEPSDSAEAATEGGGAPGEGTDESSKLEAGSSEGAKEEAETKAEPAAETEVEAEAKPVGTDEADEKTSDEKGPGDESEKGKSDEDKPTSPSRPGGELWHLSVMEGDGDSQFVDADGDGEIDDITIKATLLSPDGIDIMEVIPRNFPAEIAKKMGVEEEWLREQAWRIVGAHKASNRKPGEDFELAGWPGKRAEHHSPWRPGGRPFHGLDLTQNLKLWGENRKNMQTLVARTKAWGRLKSRTGEDENPEAPLELYSSDSWYSQPRPTISAQLRTSMSLKAKKRKETAVGKLLRLGADVSSTNDLGWTPLHVAAYAGKVGAVKAMLQHIQRNRESLLEQQQKHSAPAAADDGSEGQEDALAEVQGKPDQQPGEETPPPDSPSCLVLTTLDGKSALDLVEERIRKAGAPSCRLAKNLLAGWIVIRGDLEAAVALEVPEADGDGEEAAHKEKTNDSQQPEQGEAKMVSSEQNRWQELFNVIDRNGDGEISRTEFVKSINDDQDLARELHDLLGLPEHIRQEDGTRDAFVRAFADMDDDSSGCIDLKEFIAYLRKVQVPQAS